MQSTFAGPGANARGPIEARQWCAIRAYASWIRGRAEASSENVGHSSATSKSLLLTSKSEMLASKSLFLIPETWSPEEA